MSEELPPPPAGGPPPTSEPPFQSPPPPIMGAGGAYTGPAPDKDSATLGMLCHLLGIITSFIGPLVLWVIKKDENPFVNDQGKEALNFQIVAAVATILCFFGLCLAPFLILAVQIVRIVFSIIACIKASQGIPYRYPLTLRLVS